MVGLNLFKCDGRKVTLMFLVLTSRSGSRGGFDITRAEATNF
jgi:hypothetical protein